MELVFLCPPHCGPWLEQELDAFGIRITERSGRRLTGEADLDGIYRACLGSHVASRVLVPIASGSAASDEALIETVTRVDWVREIPAGASLSIDFRGTGGWLRHSGFGQQRVKDGIVDTLRAASRERPELTPRAPDVQVYAHFDGATLSLYRDLGAGPLHQRGYRAESVGAPIKENLGAALLMAAGWPDHDNLVDPFCGSGTLVIEAALMAAGIPANIHRRQWGFAGWSAHEPERWEQALAAARDALAAERPAKRLAGYDHDPRAISAARANAAAAGLDDWLVFTRREMAELAPPAGTEGGLLIANPPYGERLSDQASLPGLFTLLGERLRGPMRAWRPALLITDPDLTRYTGLDRRKEHRFRNGPIDCRLTELWSPPPREGRELENKLRKNQRHLGRWARKNEVEAYRVYDAEIPAFALAVDCYGDHVVAQEYAPPSTIPAATAERRLAAGLAAIGHALEIPGERIHLKTRRPQKGGQQYGRLAKRGLEMEVREGPARLIVNLSDYLDTGLFLDHRPVREWIRERADGGDMLNLFAYTGTASVHAALGGARSTTSVDLSRTYLDWAKRNLARNGFEGPQHSLIHADCVRWLGRQSARWDLILLDPPTFSNSSDTDTTLDIQRDHPDLIRRALNCLRPSGLLIFSCNRRDFRMRFEAIEGITVRDMTRASIPEDFRRNPRIHHCWFIEKDASD